METLRLLPDNEGFGIAGAILRSGGRVAFPTETVYGLGADALNPAAVASIYEAKGRPSDNPMIVHIADATDVVGLIYGGRYAIGDTASRLITNFWPGPLTLVFEKSDIVPSVTTGGLNTVAVRMPYNQTARRLIREAGRPIAAPSANISGRPSPTNADDVLEDMDGRIEAVIMGERCAVGIESTVLDLTEGTPRILRPGMITREEISEVLGGEVLYDESLFRNPKETPEGGDFRPKSPGMKYRHYSPKARALIIEGSAEEFAEKAKTLGLEAKKKGCRAAVIDYEGDAQKAARKLFADLRELDRQGYDFIFIRSLPGIGFGFSVMNRMLRSAGYDVIK